MLEPTVSCPRTEVMEARPKRSDEKNIKVLQFKMTFSVAMR